MGDDPGQDRLSIRVGPPGGDDVRLFHAQWKRWHGLWSLNISVNFGKGIIQDEDMEELDIEYADLPDAPDGTGSSSPTDIEIVLQDASTDSNFTALWPDRSEAASLDWSWDKPRRNAPLSIGEGETFVSPDHNSVDTRIEGLQLDVQGEGSWQHLRLTEPVAYHVHLKDINTLILTPDTLHEVNAGPRALRQAREDLDGYLSRAFPCQPRHLRPMVNSLRHVLQAATGAWDPLSGDLSKEGVPEAIQKDFRLLRTAIIDGRAAEAAGQGDDRDFLYRVHYAEALRSLKASILESSTTSSRLRLNYLLETVLASVDKDWYGEEWSAIDWGCGYQMQDPRFENLTFDLLEGTAPPASWIDALLAGVTAPLYSPRGVTQNAVLRVDKALRYALRLLTRDEGGGEPEAVRQAVVTALRHHEEEHTRQVNESRGDSNEDRVESSRHLRDIEMSVFRALVTEGYLPAIVFRLSNTDIEGMLQRLIMGRAIWLQGEKIQALTVDDVADINSLHVPDHYKQGLLLGIGKQKSRALIRSNRLNGNLCGDTFCQVSTGRGPSVSTSTSILLSSSSGRGGSDSS